MDTLHYLIIGIVAAIIMYLIFGGQTTAENMVSAFIGKPYAMTYNKDYLWNGIPASIYPVNKLEISDEELPKLRKKRDTAALMRGGGYDLDLSAFDSNKKDQIPPHLRGPGGNTALYTSMVNNKKDKYDNRAFTTGGGNYIMNTKGIMLLQPSGPQNETSGVDGLNMNKFITETDPWNIKNSKSGMYDYAWDTQDKQFLSTVSQRKRLPQVTANASIPTFNKPLGTYTVSDVNVDPTTASAVAASDKQLTYTADTPKTSKTD